MIVPLTWPQFQAASHWGSERHKEYLARTRTQTKHGHECGMPAAGWLSLVEILQRKAFHASGRHRKRGNAREGAMGTRSAATRIWRVLVDARRHPALRGEAMLGSWGNVFLAWPLDNGHWSLFPVDDTVVPSILVPHVEAINLFPEIPNPSAFVEYVTQWRPRPVGSLEVDGAFLDPAEHFGWGVVDLVGGDDDTVTVP